jgi:hypothetical protein
MKTGKFNTAFRYVCGVGCIHILSGFLFISMLHKNQSATFQNAWYYVFEKVLVKKDRHVSGRNMGGGDKYFYR